MDPFIALAATLLRLAVVESDSDLPGKAIAEKISSSNINMKAFSMVGGHGK